MVASDDDGDLFIYDLDQNDMLYHNKLHNSSILAIVNWFIQNILINIYTYIHTYMYTYIYNFINLLNN